MAGPGLGVTQGYCTQGSDIKIPGPAMNCSSWYRPGILHLGIRHKVTRLSNEWLVLDKMPYLAIFMEKSNS